VHAAHTLADRPTSKHARENMAVFKDAWLQQVRVLTEAVDDITTIDDFLLVSGKSWWLFSLYFRDFRGQNNGKF